MTGNKPFDILLVEDNQADATLMSEVLQSCTIPYRLHTVCDGVKALAFLRREEKYLDAPRPHLILLDLNLPRKDGIHVLSEVKKDPGLRRIPLLILSASNSAEDILKCYTLHANAYITKPMSLEGFVNVMKSIENFWFTHAAFASE